MCMVNAKGVPARRLNSQNLQIISKITKSELSMRFYFCDKNMENSPKLESLPTLCRSATLPPETTISKWRVTPTIRQLLQLPTRGTSAFGGLRKVNGVKSS